MKTKLRVSILFVGISILTTTVYALPLLNIANDDDNHDDLVLKVTAPVAPIPEPATMILFGTGLIGLAGVARRKKK